MVVSGPDVGAGHPGGWLSGLDIASAPQRLRLWAAWHGAGGTPGPALNATPAARRATESRFAVCFRLFLRPGGHTRLETALPALSPGPGDRAG